jgi:choline dehydrogenase
VPHGTAPDRGAVVDADLRVHGIDGVRVADASIMPTIVNAPTHAACRHEYGEDVAASDDS